MNYNVTNTSNTCNMCNLARFANKQRECSAHAPRLLPTRRAQHQLFRANLPRAPAHAFPSPLPWHLPTGIRAARAPPACPRPRAQWVASARDPLHAQLPRHRASNFRSHMSTHPTRVHGGCDALPSVSRLSSPNHQTFAFPPHRSERAPKASHRQRRSSSPSARHIRARSRGYNHHGGIQGRC